MGVTKDCKCRDCGTTDSIDFEINRKNICLKCRRIYNNKWHMEYRRKKGLKGPRKRKYPEWDLVSVREYRTLYMRERRQLNPDYYLQLSRKCHINERKPEHMEQLKKQIFAGHLRKYGITVEEYKNSYKEQNGLCAICGNSPKQKGWRLSVDHNHNTGKFRGLLCGNCNSALGMVDDNIEILQNMITYLNKHKEN